MQQRDPAVSTPAIFDWLVYVLSFQGVKDSVARKYMADHGQARWSDIAEKLRAGPSCPKLRSYEAFRNCRYQKGPKGSKHSCANKDFRECCPLPSHVLRKGSLNQNAYSLFLFMRDVAGNDFVGWLDKQVNSIDPALTPDQRRKALLKPLKGIYGAGDKVLSMAMSDLLLGGDPQRKAWAEAGASMIAIDTLVHNFLHRTGILHDFCAEHSYGSGCYSENGCVGIVERIASEIDARRFNPSFPENFPRFVQFAIWLFCSDSGCNRCNGTKIDDQKPCEQADCQAFNLCKHVPLKSSKQQKKPKSLAIKPKIPPPQPPKRESLAGYLNDLLIKGDDIKEITKKANIKADQIKVKKLTVGGVRAHAKWRSRKGAYRVREDPSGFIQMVPVVPQDR